MELLTKHMLESMTRMCTFSIHRKNFHLPSHIKVATSWNYWEEMETTAISFSSRDLMTCSCSFILTGFNISFSQ